jgi:putative membrane protein
MSSNNRGLWIALGVALVLILFATPLFGMGMWWRPGLVDGFGARPMVGSWVGMWTMWGVGLLVRLLFWGLLIALLVSVFRGRGRPWGGPRFYQGPRYEDSADEVLRRRYAAGEISREQFEEMRQHLSA